MKFDINNRYTNEVQFTAEIKCSEDAPRSIKIGIAVKLAVKTGANLINANLNGANLYGANLYGANLYNASLINANLNGASLINANLNGASLINASLSGANLNGASLINANLYGANLYGANLYGANISGANLINANLYGANLYGANLYGANISGANLYGATGLNNYIKCIQIEKYAICYTAEVMQIGCQSHTIAEWSGFSDAQIRAMDGKEALEWWTKYKAWIFQTIELCPATPTGYVSKNP